MSERAGVPRDACRVGWGDVGRYLHTPVGPLRITAIWFVPERVYIAVEGRSTAHVFRPHDAVTITGADA